MKILASIIILLTLTSCVELANTKDETRNYSIPAELSDCKVFFMQSPKHRDLYVMRCPNSVVSVDSTHTSGKSTKYETTITVSN